MKRYLCMILVLMLAAGIFTGCGDTADSGKSEDRSATADEQDDKTKEPGEEGKYYVYAQKHSWETIYWDKVETPHLAFVTALKELGEIPIEEDGSFEIEYSELLYEGDEATVTVNKLRIAGKIGNIKDLADAPNGTVVGSGSISAELHYNIDESSWAKPHIIDNYFTVDGDMKITVESEGESIRISSINVLQKDSIYTTLENGEKEESREELDYFLSIILEVLQK